MSTEKKHLGNSYKETTSRMTTPPQDATLEKTLLGLCLESHENYDRMTQTLQGDASTVFAIPSHAKAMTAIQTLIRENKATDLANLKIQLTKLKGWSETTEDEIIGYFEAAMSNRGYAQGVEGVALHLAQLQVKRMVIAVANDAIQRCYDQTTDGFEVLQVSASAFSRLDGPLTRHNIKHVADLIQPFFDKIQEAQRLIASGNLEMIGIPTSSTLLDETTGGDQPGELITIAARPGEGKSIKALEDAKAGAMAGYPQAILSLEMDDDMQIGRLLADMANINNSTIQRAKLTTEDWAKIQSVAENVAKLPIYLEYCPGLTILQLEPKIRWLVRAKGVKRIFIDYLQLMDGESSNKYQAQNESLRIGAITKRLKQLAGELGIAIVLLSQMSRDIEKRGGEKIPMLSDLRESGSIEQDSNKVIFLHSPAKYVQNDPNYLVKFYPNADQHVMKRITFLVMQKSRNGATGMFPMWFDRPFCRLTDIIEKSIYMQIGMVGTVPDTLALKWGWSGDYQQKLFNENENENGQHEAIASEGGDFFPF